MPVAGGGPGAAGPDRPDREGVGARSERAVLLARGAGRESSALARARELALEVRCDRRLVCVEGEAVGGRLPGSSGPAGVAVGPVSIRVFGATVSTVNVSLSGEGSTLPAASRRAHVEGVRAVRERSGRVRRGTGDERTGGCVDAALEATGLSVPVNVKVGVLSGVVPVRGEVIVVSAGSCRRPPAGWPASVDVPDGGRLRAPGRCEFRGQVVAAGEVHGT